MRCGQHCTRTTQYQHGNMNGLENREPHWDDAVLLVIVLCAGYNSIIGKATEYNVVREAGGKGALTVGLHHVPTRSASQPAMVEGGCSSRVDN